MRVVFDFASQQIAIEGDGPDLLKIVEAARALAPAITNIQISTQTVAAKVIAPIISSTAPSANAAYSGQTLKQFIKTLRFDNTAERVAAIAYYVKNHENRDTFSPKDMDGWFTIAGLQKPKQMPVAVFDAKKKHGYVESAGHAKWRLTTNGENLIVGKLNQAEIAD